MSNLLTVLLTALFSIITTQVSAQNISGIVADKDTKQPIAYANIGVVGKSIGTVSNYQGKFTLTIPSTLKKDTLKISVVGYHAFVSTIQKLTNTALDTIYLSKAITSLKEVIVKPKNLTPKTFGITTDSENITAGFSDKSLGYEAGVLMKNKHKAHLQKIKLHFTTAYDTLFYRINIYKQTKKKDFVNILTEPLYFEVLKEDLTNPVVIDLASRNIVVEGKFLVSMEIVKDLGEGNLFFSAALFRKTYYKTTSQDDWRTIPAGVSISVDALVEK